MKIYILGPSASGKSTLGEKVAAMFDCPIYHSDFVLTEYEGRSRIKLSKNEYMKKIKEILSKEKWVFEGKHIIPDLLKSADKILWLKTPLSVTLFRQWKRYFSDRDQRARFSLINNLQLTVVIIKQYMGKEDISKRNNPRYAHQKKYKRILKNYNQKVVKIKNDDDFQKFVNEYTSNLAV